MAQTRFDYAPKRARASGKIAKYGFEATFRKIESVYNPVLGRPTESVEETRGMALLSSPDKKALASGTVTLGDAMLLVSGANPEPAVNSLVEINGAEWRVLAVSLIAPANEPLLFKVYIRRA